MRFRTKHSAIDVLEPLEPTIAPDIRVLFVKFVFGRFGFRLLNVYYYPDIKTLHLEALGLRLSLALRNPLSIKAEGGAQ